MSRPLSSELANVHRRPSLIGPSNWEPPPFAKRTTEAHDAEDAVTPFGRCFAQLRQRLRQKQVYLAMEIERSEATISYWETGARLPNADNLSRILSVLARNGASTAELLSLRRSWRREIDERSMRGIWRKRSGCSDGTRLVGNKRIPVDACSSCSERKSIKR
jgi:DNA-binding transcriptional regulator YiaG